MHPQKRHGTYDAIINRVCRRCFRIPVKTKESTVEKRSKIVIKVAVADRFQLKVVPSIKNFYMMGTREVHYIGGTEVLPAPLDIEDRDKNIKLATYASRCIENEILMYLRRNSKVKAEVSIDEPLNVDWDGNELLLSDILGTEDDVCYKDLENEVEMKALKRAIGNLSERERIIVDLRYGLSDKDGEEKTQKEVADMLGISQSYISRLEKKIIKRLKREMVRSC